MTKKIEISDKAYDWLNSRCRYKKTPARVLEEVISLVERIEYDQAKYEAWMAAGKGKAETEKGKEG